MCHGVVLLQAVLHGSDEGGASQVLQLSGFAIGHKAGLGQGLQGLSYIHHFLVGKVPCRKFCGDMAQFLKHCAFAVQDCHEHLRGIRQFGVARLHGDSIVPVEKATQLLHFLQRVRSEDAFHAFVLGRNVRDGLGGLPHLVRDFPIHDRRHQDDLAGSREKRACGGIHPALVGRFILALQIPEFRHRDDHAHLLFVHLRQNLQRCIAFGTHGLPRQCGSHLTQDVISCLVLDGERA